MSVVNRVAHLRLSACLASVSGFKRPSEDAEFPAAVMVKVWKRACLVEFDIYEHYDDYQPHITGHFQNELSPLVPSLFYKVTGTVKRYSTQPQYQFHFVS